MALTDVAVRKAKPSQKAYRIADGLGMYLLVTPAGGKLWRWKYRFAGREKLMALGQYPDVSIAQARERHADARKVLRAGEDPMVKRKSEKRAWRAGHADSFESIAKLWHEHWRDGKSARHIAYVWRRMEADILPMLGSRPIRSIEAPELVTMVKAIEARGAMDIAKRAFETTGQVFRYAIAHGLASRNPAKEIQLSDVLKMPSASNFARVDAKELPTLLKAIEAYQGTNLTRLAMRFIALTFVRTGEMIGAKWQEVDFDNARWDIPAERMKMKTPHIVPLSSQAIAVLETLRTFSGSEDWIFPSNTYSKSPMSNNTILKALERMGYKGRMTGHGFRGLASTILHEQGFPHEHIEAQLAHAKRNEVSAAYNHALYLEPRAKMMQHWADFLDRTQGSGKLLTFKSGAA